MINATTNTYNNSKLKTNSYITSFDNYRRYILIPSNSSYWTLSKKDDNENYYISNALCSKNINEKLSSRLHKKSRFNLID